MIAALRCAVRRSIFGSSDSAWAEGLLVGIGHLPSEKFAYRVSSSRAGHFRSLQHTPEQNGVAESFMGTSKLGSSMTMTAGRIRGSAISRRSTGAAGRPN